MEGEPELEATSTVEETNKVEAEAIENREEENTENTMVEDKSELTTQRGIQEEINKLRSDMELAFAAIAIPAKTKKKSTPVVATSVKKNRKVKMEETPRSSKNRTVKSKAVMDPVKRRLMLESSRPEIFEQEPMYPPGYHGLGAFNDDYDDSQPYPPYPIRARPSYPYALRPKPYGSVPSRPFMR